MKKSLLSISNILKGLVILLLITIVFLLISLKKDVSNNKQIVYISGKTIFFGDSITERYDLDKYFHNSDYINKGIGGNTTRDLLARINKDVIDYNPSNVVILIGTNDYSVGKIGKEETIQNIENLLLILKIKLPETKIYVESIYPVDEEKTSDRFNEDYRFINDKVKLLCEDMDYVSYVDLYNNLLDGGKLNSKYSEDGLHLNNDGYVVVSNKLSKYLTK